MLPCHQVTLVYDAGKPWIKAARLTRNPEYGRRWQSRVMLLGGPGGKLLPGVQTGALGCFGTAVQEPEFSRADVQQVSRQACKQHVQNRSIDI